MRGKLSISIDASWFGNTGIGRVASEVIARRPSGWIIKEIRVGMKNASLLTPASISANIKKIPTQGIKKSIFLLYLIIFR